MSLSITSIQRIGPVPCQHFLVTINEDGESRTVFISRDDISSLLQNSEHGFKVTLVLAWLRYKVAQGATPQSLVGEVIV